MIELPAEIYRNIFDYLREEGLFECFLVCKKWHLYATQVYWKEVSIHSKRIENIKSLLYEYNCEKYFKYGHLTQKMYFLPEKSTFWYYFDSCSESNVFIEDEVIQFMSYFPNVKEITVNKECYKDHLRLLLNVDLKNIRKITASSKINLLEYTIYNLYLDICMKHSDTITSLSFDYTENTGVKNDQYYLDISTIPDTFNNITELEFRNLFDGSLTFMQIQAIFPNLVNFYFESSYLLDNYSVQEEIDEIGDSAIHFNRNLKRLEIVADYPVSYVKYLTKYLPDQLVKISLIIRHTCLHLWLDKIGEENVLKLMERLNKVESASIFFPDEKTYDPAVPIGTSKITNHFKVINTLIGNRKTYFSLRVSYSPTERNICTYSSSEGSKLVYTTNTYSNFNEKEDNTFEFSLLDQTNSTIRFDHVNCMDFYYDSKFNKHPDLCCAFTEYILANFSNLDKFTFSDNSVPCPVFLASTLNETKRKKVSGSTQENLKLVRIKNIAKHKKMLHVLATHLLCIESMHYQFGGIHGSFTSTFNLKAFNSLTKFYFYVGENFSKDSPFVMVDIRCENNQKRRHCYNIRTYKITTEDEIKSNTRYSKPIYITFESNQCTLLNLYDWDVGIVATFRNGDLLNLDYPIEEFFPPIR